MTDNLSETKPSGNFSTAYVLVPAFLMLIVLVFFALFGFGFAAPAGAASQIKILVNGEPITSYDIARRAAFFRLRRIKGNSKKLATEELIDEALKMQTAKRLKMIAGQKEVDAAYARFAKTNRMPVRALTQVLNRAGVTKRGFQKFVRAQMSWQRVMAAKLRSESSRSSTQDIFADILQKGGKKPSTTEYTLQQVIFVVPKAKRRTRMARRRREARAFRNRFENCGNTIQFAKKLKDVTVRSLGRVMQQQLPPDWKKYIVATAEGKTTKIRDTQRGVEFIAICRSQKVSDDRVAQLNFQLSQAKKGKTATSEAEKKFVQELRDRAVITRR